MLKAYLASAFANKALIRAMREALHERFPGLIVTSSWLDVEETTDPAPFSELRAKAAIMCADDVRRSEILVFVDSSVPSRGGLVEVGIAIGSGIPVLWNRERGDVSRNVFDAFPTVRAVNDSEMIGWLSRNWRIG